MTHSYFGFRTLTRLNRNRFSPNLICALILWRSGLGFLLGTFHKFWTELSPHDTIIAGYHCFTISLIGIFIVDHTIVVGYYVFALDFSLLSLYICILVQCDTVLCSTENFICAFFCYDNFSKLEGYRDRFVASLLALSSSLSVSTMLGLCV